MTDQVTAPDPMTTGQAGATPAAAGTTAPAPGSPEGQGTGTDPTAGGQAAAQAPPAEPTFFDPKTLDPALLPAYKQMQGTFTKKLQELGSYREKVTAYDQFMADPVTNLQNLAAQYGMSLSRREAAAAINQQSGHAQEWDGQSDPPSWQAVLDRAKTMAREELLKEFGPVVQNVRQLQAKSVEQQLETIDPEWRTYEPKMRELLKDDPALGNNIKRLYSLALLEEGVFEARAIRQAQERMNASASAARVGTKSTTTSQPAPKKVNDFNDAVAEAKRILASGTKR